MHRSTWNTARRPTPSELVAAEKRRLPDVIAPDLDVLFCGINPGLYSTAIGHHFGRPGNRFWPALFASGFTPRLFSPYEDRQLLDLGLGLTNLVPRTTATADQLSADELRTGASRLRQKVARTHPRFVAILGFTAYRTAFAKPDAEAGPQPTTVHDATVWLLPNPSGLNAHHQPRDLARAFRALYVATRA